MVCSCLISHCASSSVMEKPKLIQEQIPLAPLTTLGVGGKASYFCVAETIDELRECVLWARSESLPITCIGGGSNILVQDDGVAGLVIQIAFSSRTYEERGDVVSVTVGAGVPFDALVGETVTRGLWGLENLSAIPGTVGGVPIQNVGAYGVEACDVILSVEVFDRALHTVTVLTNEQCQFAYRDSLFKREG